MEQLLKVAAIGIVGCILALLIKKTNPEFSLVVTICVSVAAVGVCASMMGGIREAARLAEEVSGLSPAVFSPVLKCMGIGIVTKLSADLCKDAGQSAIASSVELAGAFAALYVSLPLVEAFFEMIGRLV